MTITKIRPPNTDEPIATPAPELPPAKAVIPVTNKIKRITKAATAMPARTS